MGVEQAGEEPKGHHSNVLDLGDRIRVNQHETRLSLEPKIGEVRLIVWGPSARLLAGDKDLQAKIKAMIKDGVVVQACIACADSYGVTETLRGLGIEVKAMGKPLTDILQSDYKTLTF